MVTDGAPPGRATIEALCRSVVARLGPDGGHGVSVTQWVSGDVAGLVYSSDPLAAKLHEIQLTLGEGPDLMAREHRAPVLVADLSTDPVTEHWVMFAREASQAGACSVFVFPLQIGVVMLGSLTLHSRAQTALTDTVISEVLQVADLLALSLLVPGATADSPIDQPFPNADGEQAVTHQATGMVMVQLGSTLAAALVTMRAYAYAHDLALTQVARAVVDRTLDFAAGARADNGTTDPADTSRGSGSDDDPDEGGAS